jgi:hypothetical protein
MYCFDHGSVHRYAGLSTLIQENYVLLSACAGEFIHIGLPAGTTHRGTTMFDRYPT